MKTETNLKLEISQLKNYLGTGLEITLKTYPFGDQKRLFELDCGHDFHHYLNSGLITFEMYRLQDLDKFIPELGFVPLDELSKGLDFSFASAFSNLMIEHENITNVPFWAIQKLFEWHFWVFDQSFFEEGLIIDNLK